MANRWFRCKGCDGLIALLGDGLMPHYRPGSVAHTKPAADVNVRPAKCRLYQESECETLWAMHENDPEVDAPLGIRPVMN